MRMADTKAGRKALGAAAAAGVRHMAHRFIVGETPREASGVLEGLWHRGVATCVDLLGEATVTPARPTATPRAAARRSRGSRRLRQAPERPALERDSAGRIPRANLSVKVSALTPLLRARRARAAASATPRRACASSCATRASSARTCTSTWSRSTRARRSPTSCSSCSPRTSSATARPPGSCCRPTCATPRSCGPHPRRGRRRRRALPAARAPRQGRLLGPRDRRGAPARLGVARLRGQGRLRPQLRGAHAAPARGAAAGARRHRLHNLRSVAHAVAANRASARGRATSSSRSCAASATTSSRRSRRSACASGPTARWATSSPEWPTSCAGCSRTRPTVLPARAGARRAARRAPGGAVTGIPQRAPRSSSAGRPARAAAAGHARARAHLPLRVPLWIGCDRREGCARLDRPGRPAASWRSRRGDRGRRRRRGPGRPRGFPGWAAQRGRSARRDPREGGHSMRARRPELAALVVRECAKPWDEADADVCEAIDFLEFYARGASRSTAARRSSRCPASATRCATRRAASWR